MNKNDLKKLALLGITGGVMLSSQGVVQAENTVESSILAHSCGSACNGQSKTQPSKYAGCSQQGRPVHGCSQYSGCSQKRPASGCSQFSGCSQKRPSAGCHAQSYSGIIADASEDESYKNTQLMTEDQLQSQLNSEGKSAYNRLSPEGKAEALKIASRGCKGMNDCKGLGGCKTSKHDCAGKNDCKGQGGCAVKDKNQAVKMAEKAQKRAKTNSGSY